MEHNCGIEKEDQKEDEKETFCQRVKRKWQSLILVSPDNPVRFAYFKSDLALKKEQRRHLKTNQYVIHPFSKFRGSYEVLLVLLYLNALIMKPMSCFFSIRYVKQSDILKEYTIMTDLSCWMDIVMTFFTGITKHNENSNIIELRFCPIAKHYILGPYFICDVLSSIPKGILYFPSLIHIVDANFILNITLDMLMLLKLVRIVPLFHYIYKSVLQLGIKSKMIPFFSCIILTMLLSLHWAACLQFAIPRLTIFYAPDKENITWISQRKLKYEGLLIKYNQAFFKASALILGIRIDTYVADVAEEYILSILTYFIGKLIVAFVWLLLAMAILNDRSIHIKFLELVDQLEEYMTRKKLPMSLKDRISNYYNFKYQKKYFSEDLIRSLLPDTIKNEVTMHICKTMIKNVSIFSDLSHEEISGMVDHLVPEIFLPQDTIIQHGTYGDAMYFLSSGTVAVYTRSGKEICHLQDGAYFGEISMLIPDQMRVTTIMAIEASQVYRLDKRGFERYLLNNKRVLYKIKQVAEERLRQSTLMEEQYKKMLLEQQITPFK